MATVNPWEANLVKGVPCDCEFSPPLFCYDSSLHQTVTSGTATGTSDAMDDAATAMIADASDDSLYGHTPGANNLPLYPTGAPGRFMYPYTIQNIPTADGGYTTNYFNSYLSARVLVAGHGTALGPLSTGNYTIYRKFARYAFRFKIPESGFYKIKWVERYVPAQIVLRNEDGYADYDHTIANPSYDSTLLDGTVTIVRRGNFAPLVTFAAPPTVEGAIQAKGVAVMAPDGTVASVKIIHPGFGYLAAPAVAFSHETFFGNSAPGLMSQYYALRALYDQVPATGTSELGEGGRVAAVTITAGGSYAPKLTCLSSPYAALSTEYQPYRPLTIGTTQLAPDGGISAATLDPALTHMEPPAVYMNAPGSYGLFPYTFPIFISTSLAGTPGDGGVVNTTQPSYNGGQSGALLVVTLGAETEREWTWDGVVPDNYDPTDPETWPRTANDDGGTYFQLPPPPGAGYTYVDKIVTQVAPDVGEVWP